MTPRPSRPVRALASALAVGTLLTTAACSDGHGGDAGGSDVVASPVAKEAGETGEADKAKKSPTPTATAALTKAQAQTALITAAFLEERWTQAKDADTWHNSLLTGKVDEAAFTTDKSAAADCQRLIDGLYDEDLLGKPSGASALTGFTEGNSRLLYQVATYSKDDLDKSLPWLKSLPTKCDQFTVNSSEGDRTVQVVAAPLPKGSDARQAVTVTVQGSTGGMPVTLALDVAAVQVGPNAITVTNGGVDGVDHDSTGNAVLFGTQRLKDVLAGKSPAPSPSEFE
ncbi:hypothetical protein [Streptomyces sp. NPDC002088]|uniref:hypothetical protein n=1 Tax=Streptomyces sp. NPDC002088 TaxID=3154665 RepID=UPI0033202AFA